jgi:methylthioribose-1-phosphate isomerase
VVNGVGTYLMALAARQAGVPFYVLCEKAKFDPRMQSCEIETEERNPSELAAPGILPEGVTAKNPYFDLTPLQFVTGIITEEGLVKQNEVLAYVEKLAGELR